VYRYGDLIPPRNQPYQIDYSIYDNTKIDNDEILYHLAKQSLKKLKKLFPTKMDRKVLFSYFKRGYLIEESHYFKNKLHDKQLIYSYKDGKQNIQKTNHYYHGTHYDDIDILKLPLSTLQEYIDNGYDINVIDSSNLNAIFKSYLALDYDRCKLLLQNGADVLLKEKSENRNILDYIVFYSQFRLSLKIFNNKLIKATAVFEPYFQKAKSIDDNNTLYNDLMCRYHVGMLHDTSYNLYCNSSKSNDFLNQFIGGNYKKILGLIDYENLFDSASKPNIIYLFEILMRRFKKNELVAVVYYMEIVAVSYYVDDKPKYTKLIINYLKHYIKDIDMNLNKAFLYLLEEITREIYHRDTDELKEILSTVPVE
jgi:hypothetical protein